MALSAGCPDEETPPDPTPEDDDDTTDEEEEEEGPNFDGITFTFRMEVVSEDVGDDDDSAGDPPNEERGRRYTVEFEHTISYWIDVQNGVPYCEQIVRSQAEAWFDYGIVVELGVDKACPQFTGFIEIDPETLEDLSNPELDPDQCDMAEFDAVGRNYGRLLLTPADPNAQPPTYGDFLQMATIDVGTHRILGLELNTQGNSTADVLAATYDEAELKYVGASFIQPVAGSLAAGAGLDQIANKIGDGCNWLAGFEMFTNPELNPHDPEANFDYEGEYGGTAGFLLTFTQ
jgi:hypothetical protein